MKEQNKIEENLTIAQEKMSKVFESNMGEIPLDDQEACDLMASAELLFNIYNLSPALTGPVIENSYVFLQEMFDEFARTRGVVFEKKEEPRKLRG